MSPADNRHHLAQAARRRAVDTRQRALAAIAHLAAEGHQVTPTAVARRAGVSRQWLYTSDEAMSAISAAHVQGRRRRQCPV